MSPKNKTTWMLLSRNITKSRGKHPYRLYKCNTCGISKELRTDHVKSNQASCGNCLQIKLNKEAKEAGLIYIGRARHIDRHTHTYQFEACGHKQHIRPSGIREMGKVTSRSDRCNICFEKTLKEEAKEAGLKVIGSGKVNRHGVWRVYEFLDCGHIKEMRIEYVRDRRFICNECEITSVDLPSNVYLLKIKVGKEEWLKLGYAKKVSSRIKFYGLPSTKRIRRLKVIPFDTGREAQKFESSIHNKYKSKRLPIRKMKAFHKNGFNECYPLEMLDKLLEELDSK